MTDNFVNTGKWSHGEERVVVRDDAREESEVIPRSRMWFLLWVGKLTSWV